MLMETKSSEYFLSSINWGSLTQYGIRIENQMTIITFAFEKSETSQPYRLVIGCNVDTWGPENVVNKMTWDASTGVLSVKVCSGVRLHPVYIHLCGVCTLPNHGFVASTCT